MTQLEPTLKLALALHENPGAYALLIGSGVSRDAAVPTGWEILLDLVRKVAAVTGEEASPNPEEWYRKKFGESPDYSKLLDRLAGTSTERMGMLRSYFEPTEEEREKGLKVPTDAHKAVAQLVKYGYIRMILTTNFDRLIERALEENGITSDVISSDDSLKGAMPYIHSRCTVVKLHGDYRDVRIKNTPEELENYSSTLNAFLDRVLDDFGLIICGWSGSWDLALRKAILRCPTRRFTTFWLSRSELTSEAKEITQHRRADIILIESANRFFSELLEKIESLRELELPSPISTAIAVATVKRFVAEPRHWIRLHDLIHEETERVCRELASERFNPSVEPLTKEIFQQRVQQYEAIVDRLMAMLSALAYHDAGENAHLLTRSIDRLAQVSTPTGSYKVALFDLKWYPALLVTYATGISAFGAEKFQNLAAILRKTGCRVNRETKPAVQKLNVWSVFKESYKWAPRPDAEREYTPVSNHLLDIIRPVVRDYLPDDTRYEEVFDIFEYVLMLTHTELVKDSWVPAGRFIWKYERLDWNRTPIAEFLRAGVEMGVDWGLLKTGFFEGSLERFKEILKQAAERLEPWKHRVL